MTGHSNLRTEPAYAGRLLVVALLAAVTAAGLLALAGPAVGAPAADAATADAQIAGASSTDASLAGASTADASLALQDGDSDTLVDDYDDPTAWSNNQNDLGDWTGGGNYQSMDVADGTLELSYDGGGWFVTNAYTDVSQHDQLVVVARGETGTEAQDLTLQVGQSSDSIAALSGQEIGSEFSAITVDLADIEVDESSFGEIRINGPHDGSTGTLEIDEIYFGSAQTAEGPTAGISGVPSDPLATDRGTRLSADVETGDAAIDSYQWDLGDGTVVDGYYVDAGWSESGDYTVELTVTDENGLTDTATADVQVRDPPTWNSVTIPTEVTVNETVQYEADASAGDAPLAEYTWSFDHLADATGSSPTYTWEEPGNYTVKAWAVDENDLYAAETQRISVVEADGPAVEITNLPDGHVEPSEQFRLESQVTSDAAIESYEWDFGDGTTQSGWYAWHHYTETGDHTVELTVTDENGQTGTATATIEVRDGPTAAFTGRPDGVIAPGDSFRVVQDAEAGAEPIEHYQWDMGDGTIVNGSWNAHSYDERGNYPVELTVTDAAGLTDSTAATVLVRDPPTATIDAAPAELDVDEAGAFEATVEAGDASIESVEWDFDDGTNASGESATHAFDAAGDYAVDLIVTDANGLTDRQRQLVTVTEPSDAPVAQVSMEYSLVSPTDGHEVNLTVDNPSVLDRSDVEQLEVDTSFADVVDQNGFSQSDSDEDVWQADGSTSAPYLLVHDDGTQTWSDSLSESHLFDVQPDVDDISLDASDSAADVSLTASVAGEGYALPHADVVFFGAEENETVNTDHGPLTVTYPSELDQPTDIQRLADGLAEYSAAVRFGPEFTASNGFLMPTDASDRGGLAFTQRFHTQEGTRFDETGSTWIHEFAHITEDADLHGGETEWIVEASASYYSYEIPLQLDHGSADSEIYDGTTYNRLEHELEEGRSDVGNLTNETATDEEGFDYTYGQYVMAATDRQIRLNSEDNTFQDVLVRLHEVEGTPTHEDYERIVADLSNREVANQSSRWARAEEVPEMWTVQEYEEAFGYDVPAPRLDASLTASQTGDEIVVVDGDGSTDEVDRVDLGEPMALDVTVSNDGSAPDGLVVNMTAEDETVASSTVQYGDTGASSTTVEHAFQQRGRYQIEMDVESAGPFTEPMSSLVDGVPKIREYVVVVGADDALLRGTGDTTAENPATVAPDAHVSITSSNTFLDPIQLEAVDGSDSLTVERGPSNQFGSVPASELQTDTVYRVNYQWPSQDDQYVAVEDDGAPTGPTASIAGAPADNVTTDDSVSLSADVTEGDAAIQSYDWTMGDETSSSGSSVSHSYDAAGEYTVELTVTDENGETDSDTATIVVEDAADGGDDDPHAEIVPTTTTASVGEDVGFDMEKHTDWYTYISWDMDDGTTYSDDYYVTHSFDSPGSYTVALTTENGHDGTRTTDTVTIEVS